MSRNIPELDTLPKQVADFIDRISHGYGGDCYIQRACVQLYRWLATPTDTPSLPVEEVPPMSSELITWVDDKARGLMGNRDLHYGGFRDAAQWLAVRLAQSQKECSRLILQANNQDQELSSLREQLAFEKQLVKR